MDGTADRPAGPLGPPGEPGAPGAPGAPQQGSDTALFEVTVERSGGIAGMVRRWSAPVPDDGGPAARAAHRIADLTTAECSTQRPGTDGPGRVRDGFVWAVTCGEGSLQCDEEGRRRDPEVDALISVVTAPE
ncbi:hypothetical protein [Citricoccus sp. K5]|uniref:hypothetical protein n=1 Tax=Citricoccus sp. K5 TaxID=2653135 RepID=UPI0012F44FD5|nr:hypothetical protein [Citricoccus sp. K5]VXB96438.1 conserved hypothetical protein [Citricoccus sp. K5]